jgi:hypothetical protein
MMLRSNSANTPSIWKRALPAGVLVSTPRAPARAQLDRLKADPQWFQKLMAGEAEATAEYEQLDKDLAD